MDTYRFLQTRNELKNVYMFFLQRIREARDKDETAGNNRMSKFLFQDFGVRPNNNSTNFSHPLVSLGLGQDMNTRSSSSCGEGEGDILRSTYFWKKWWSWDAKNGERKRKKRKNTKHNRQDNHKKQTWFQNKFKQAPFLLEINTKRDTKTVDF